MSTTSGLRGSDTALADAFDLALIDLDGVAYRGHEPIDGAAEGISGARARGMRTVFVTNNASREPSSVAAQLSGLGIPTSDDEVMTAAIACARLLTTRLEPGAKVLVVGGPGLLTAVRHAGFTVVTSADDKPAAVAQGFAPELGWAQLAEAAYAVEGGAWHVASNLDLSLPTARGFAPGNGSLVGAVQAATGVVPSSAGKPAPDMYRMVVEQVGAERPLVVGDRLDTDLAGARTAGYAGVHVLTGVSTARDAALAPAQMRPDFIIGDLRALLLPQPVAVLDAGWWRVGQRAARVVDGAVQLSPAGGEDADIDLIRAMCHAVWTSVDAGEAVDAALVPDLGIDAPER